MKTHKMMRCVLALTVALFVGVALNSSPAFAAACPPVTHDQLTTALTNSIFPTGAVDNGGLNLHMWATIVDRDGEVCLVTRSGNLGDQWPASRPISAQKAYTANSLTVNDAPGIFSTALLFTPTKPGQFLWGLHQSNPVDPAVVYGGDTAKWGASDDPMVGKIPGGVNTFGGGVSLWDTAGNVVGAVGVSGDTSCADHNIALRVRDNLVAATALANNPAGQYADNIIYDIKKGASKSGFGHPTCAGDPGEVDVNEDITGVTHPKHDAFPFKR